MNIIKKVREAIKREKASYWHGYYERWPEYRESRQARYRRECQEEEERFMREWDRSQAFRDKYHDNE